MQFFVLFIFLWKDWWVNVYAPVWYVHICKYMRVCVCVMIHSAHSLWSGLRSCVARVTSFSAMLVGMWWVWLRPAHKTLHPGTVLLPLQTGKQRPMGKPHRRPASKASLYCCFFSVPHMLQLSWPGGQDLKLLAVVVFCLCDQFHFTWRRRIELLWKPMSLDLIILNVRNWFSFLLIWSDFFMHLLFLSVLKNTAMSWN